MSRDPLVEEAGQQLEAVYSKALKYVQEWFEHGDKLDKTAHRISIIAVMKLLVELIKVQKDYYLHHSVKEG